MKQHRLIGRLEKLDSSVGFVFCIDFKAKLVNVTAVTLTSLALERYSKNINCYTRFLGWEYEMTYATYSDGTDVEICSGILTSFKEYINGRKK